MTVAKSLGWYGRRLAVMGPAEIGYRIAGQLNVQALRWDTWAMRVAGADRRRPADFAFCRGDAPQLPALPWAFDATVALHDGLAEGRWPALGFEWQWAEDRDCWHQAPDTGATWPRKFFASIPYRAGNPHGDVRVAWKPARLQQLVGLALLANCPGHDRTEAVALIEAEFLSWLAANPPYRGVHYISAMECALRLIALCHALDLVRAQIRRGDEIWSGLVGLVRSHAALIERRLSLHSSAGNHTIAECAGLVYAGTLFPELAGAGRWRRVGLDLLTREADRQILPDGGGLEQAFWYQLFVTDLSGLACALLQHRGTEAPRRLLDATERGWDFLGATAAGSGDIPAVGDRDDGYALAPWLMLSRRRLAEPAPCRTFPDAGYSRIRAAGAMRLDVLFDHGPLGMPPLFGHGHADALSVVVRINGRDVLVDPGTYTYTGDPAWRRHFRATAAHNTVCVDGQDQAVQETAFSWSAPYACRLVRAEAADGRTRLLAQHDGYSRLAGIRHWRGIAVHPTDGMLIWDYLTGGGEHAVQLNWHAVGPVAAGAAGRWTLAEDALLEIQGAGTISDAVAGPADAAGGWLSPVYGRKQPISCLRAERRGPLPCEFTTYLVPRRSSPRADFAQDLAAFRRWLA